MRAAPEPALAAEGVTHRYGSDVALRGVSLRVAPGERFALLGPNGGGKTTLFRLAATLMRPSEGHVAVFGHNAAEAPGAVRRLLGVVFQQPALDGELTVRENVRAHAALVGVPRAEVSARVAEVLVLLGLEAHAGRRVEALSGGLARRADLARALLHRPPLLLLDEPTTGLDPVARRALWDALDALRRRDGTTQVVATHLMDEAERCDRVGILDRGRLVALDAPDALKARLGAETLWLDTPDPAALQAALSDRLAVPSRRVGRTVLVEAEAPAALLPRIYETCAALIEQATVRKPTLEDVFVATTGHAWSEDSGQSSEGDGQKSAVRDRG